MPSRLSSLLVRDGLVGVKRMEKAFQRQVIYGGALDTILLESNLVPEDRLLQYLSLSTGLPPATRGETNVFDAEAIKVCPADLARSYRVVPLCFRDDALRVLVHDPVDMSLLEELATELGQAIQPMVVPEYRWHVVCDRMFGRSSDARFLKLAKQAEEQAPAAPVGKPRTVIVEEPAPAAAPEDSDHVVVDVGLPPPAAAVQPRRAGTAPLYGLPDEAAPGGNGAGAQARPVATPVPDAPSGPTATPGGPVASTRASIDLDDISAMTPEEAREALGAADDRDLIFAILLRAIRTQAWYAGLLTIQGGAAIGRVAIAGDQIERGDISGVLIPLDTPSAFATAAESGSPYVGPIATGDAEVDGMIERMGGVVPPAALLLPISLRNRVVAVAIGHRGGDRIGAADVAPVLPLAGAAAEALSRLIVKSKASGYRGAGAPGRADEAPIEPADDAPTEPHQRGAEAEPELDYGTEVSFEAGEPDPIEAVFDALESGDEDSSEAAMEEALRRADESVRLLGERFPGALRMDRYQAEGRPTRAAQHGPVLDLVIRLGTVAADVLYAKMRDADRDVRYYATVCAAELRPRSLIAALVDRLFDSDYGIRRIALDALGGYPTRELDSNLVRARHALSSDDPDRVKAAVDAVAELADVGAIPELIEVVGRGHKNAAPARRALVALTAADFGSSARKWRSWWNKHKGRHRIEWLIEGLGHKDEEVRRSAMETLRQLTGEYFGYHHDLAKKEREAARERWQRWWNETGRRRFLRSDRPDEAQHATAELPARRP